MEKTRAQIIDYLKQCSPPFTAEQIANATEWMEFESRIVTEVKAAVMAELAKAMKR